MNADGILSKVLEFYQSCSSYTDAGEVSSDMASLRFSTHFCRPSKFRFDWSLMFSGQTRRGVIFSESGTRASRFDGNELEDVDGLALGIAGATGTSLGVAPMVAHLLMPNLFEIGQFESLVSLKPYVYIGEENSCFKIGAYGPQNCSTLLFVDKVKPILRKIELRTAPTLEEKQRGIEALELLEGTEVAEVRALSLMEDTSFESIILYNDVQFDVPISSDLFRRV